jgi:hypothetical protein
VRAVVKDDEASPLEELIDVIEVSLGLLVSVIPVLAAIIALSACARYC